jgi:hypothetical protein
MQKKAVVAAIVAATVSSAPARADDGITDFGRIPGTWYRLTMNNETSWCGADATFSNGLQVFMAHIPQNNSWYFMLGHRSWQFKKGRVYDGSVSVDGKLFTGETTAVNERMVGLPISNKFMHAFTAGGSLTIHHTSGVPLATISLAGTSKMVTAVARCSATVQAQQQPFGPPRTYSMPETPFAPKADGNVGRRFAGPERAA